MVPLSWQVSFKVTEGSLLKNTKKAVEILEAKRLKLEIHPKTKLFTRSHYLASNAKSVAPNQHVQLLEKSCSLGSVASVPSALHTSSVTRVFQKKHLLLLQMVMSRRNKEWAQSTQNQLQTKIVNFHELFSLGEKTMKYNGKAKVFFMPLIQQNYWAQQIHNLKIKLMIMCLFTGLSLSLFFSALSNP